MVIRSVAPDDWREWRELRLAALATDPAAFGSRLADWASAPEERWRARLALPGLHTVAELDGARVGLASGIHADDPATIELISLWVAPAARGRGVGDALVAAVVAWGEARGLGTTLAVRRDNAPAIRLYARHGFVATGELPDGEQRMVRALT